MHVFNLHIVNKKKLIFNEDFQTKGVERQNNFIYTMMLNNYKRIHPTTEYMLSEPYENMFLRKIASYKNVINPWLRRNNLLL